MAKYTALDSKGNIADFVCVTDKEAITIARIWHYQCLIKVRSFEKSSPIATLLHFRQEGH